MQAEYMTPKTAEQMLNEIYDLIKIDGAREARKPGSLGGIWTADTYNMGDSYAQLCDDGSTRAIGNKRGFKCWSTYGRPVEYWSGSKLEDLIAMWNELCAPMYEPLVKEVEDRPMYLWL